MKTRREILSQPFVNISEISRLLQIPRDRAKTIFQICDEEEQQKVYRVHINKVPLQRALQVAGVNYAFLSKQIN